MSETTTTTTQPAATAVPRPTRVVHVHSAEWAATPPEERVYIGRAMPKHGFKASRWGNPYRVNKGTPAAKAVALYEGYLRQAPGLQAALHELRGKVLGCWCKQMSADPGDAPCHGDVLARLADQTAAWEA